MKRLTRRQSGDGKEKEHSLSSLREAVLELVEVEAELNCGWALEWEELKSEVLCLHVFLEEGTYSFPVKSPESEVGSFEFSYTLNFLVSLGVPDKRKGAILVDKFTHILSDLEERMA